MRPAPAAYYKSAVAPAPPSSDQVRSSVLHLLAKAFTLPCLAAAQAFTQMVQPTARFQIALDNVLPLLTGNADLIHSVARTQTPRRILASYILYSLYSDYPMVLNPFRCVFIEIFLHEREVAKLEAEQGGASETEQLVWVLWKILRGEGNDLSPYSPATLASSPLPPKLRAPNLAVEDSPVGDDDVEIHLPSPISSGSGGSVRSQGSSSAPSPIESNGSRRFSSTSTLVDAREEFIAQGMHCLLAACSRVLTLTEQRVVAMALPHFAANTFIKPHDLPTLLTLNTSLGHPVIVSLLKMVPDSTSNYNSRIAYLDVLRHLPPTLPSFDILGRLLRDGTPVVETSMEGKTTIADLVRMEVLGAFVLNCIGWVEQSERDAQEGLLCRFYNTLIKLGIVDPSSDADSVEMSHFSLSHARLEEANNLYRVLALGKF
ncbi:hypothetical protein SCHPADRAFT_926514 [Schizopora paradoxa]|uniref:Uncharacterized protein n=1 Tax=Schizopora paradoxa TaxID=27342 RepID=A0A0H2S4A9_9AGAM|nr:hypothetical protein SCHPADRAFT_926514 [Schizopora paradoxa]